MKRRRAPFPCPVCTKPLTRIVETVPWQGGIRRRRECEDGHRVSTVERLLKAA